MTLEEAILPAIAGSVFGSQYVPQKKLGNVNTGHYNLTMAVGILGTSSVIFTILFLLGMPPLHWIPMIIAFLGGIVWSMGNRLSISAVNRIGMSKSTILFNLTSVFSFIFGILFFTEPVGFFKGIGMPIIICGSVIVAAISGEEKKNLNWPGIMVAVLASLLFSIFNTLSSESMSSPIFPTIPYYVLAFLLSLGSLVGNLLFINTPRKIKEWASEKPKFHYWALLGGIIWGVAIFISLYSLWAYGLSFTIPILQTVQLIISALWGILYFKEIHQRKHLILFLGGAGVSIVGIILFSL